MKKQGKPKKPAKAPNMAKLLGVDLRDPAAKLGVMRAEDVLEDLQPRRARLRGATIRGFTLPPLDQLAALIALIMSLLPKPKPVQPPAPPPVPVDPGQPPVEPEEPAEDGPRHRIDGGTAKVTGIQEGVGGKWKDDEIVPGSVRAWVELDEARVDAICAEKANAPQVCRIMTDATPKAGSYVFKPKDPTWEQDPQPGSVEDPGAEPMRLVWEDDTDQIYLTHEYHDYGCRNWIRCSIPPGTGAEIRDPHYVGPRYGSGSFANIPLTRKNKVVKRIVVGRGA